MDVTRIAFQTSACTNTNAALLAHMSAIEQKTETLNLRVSPKVKAALLSAARREHRSMANMVEHLVLGYCEEHGLVAERETEGAEEASQHT